MTPTAATAAVLLLLALALAWVATRPPPTA